MQQNFIEREYERNQETQKDKLTDIDKLVKENDHLRTELNNIQSKYNF